MLKTCCWAGIFPLCWEASRDIHSFKKEIFSQNFLNASNCHSNITVRGGILWWGHPGSWFAAALQWPRYIKLVLNFHNHVVFSSRAGHTMKKMEPHFFFVTLIKYLCQKLNRKFTHNSWPIFSVPIIFCSFFSSFWTSRLSWMRTSSHSKMSGVSPFCCFNVKVLVLSFI